MRNEINMKAIKKSLSNAIIYITTLEDVYVDELLETKHYEDSEIKYILDLINAVCQADDIEDDKIKELFDTVAGDIKLDSGILIGAIQNRHSQYNEIQSELMNGHIDTHKVEAYNKMNRIIDDKMGWIIITVKDYLVDLAKVVIKL